MPGKHKFVACVVPMCEHCGESKTGNAVGVPICEHCGESKTDLDQRRVDEKLPSCPDAPDEPSQPPAGKYEFPMMYDILLKNELIL